MTVEILSMAKCVTNALIYIMFFFLYIYVYIYSYIYTCLQCLFWLFVHDDSTQRSNTITQVLIVCSAQRHRNSLYASSLEKLRKDLWLSGKDQEKCFLINYSPFHNPFWAECCICSLVAHDPFSSLASSHIQELQVFPSCLQRAAELPAKLLWIMVAINNVS